MPSFEEALRVGADAIETDIRVSSDLKVVVFHDADASRLVGHSGTIESSPWSEIADWDLGMPTRTYPETVLSSAREYVHPLRRSLERVSDHAAQYRY